MCTSLLRKIFKSTFLPKLTTKGKEYSKIGQNLEGSFCNTPKRDLPNFLVGLVVKRNKNYAKASCDFMGVVTIEERNCLQAQGVRLDLHPGTHQRERALTELLPRFHSSTSLNSNPRTTTSTGTVASRDLLKAIQTQALEEHILR
jgi:hypothetical protein